MSSIAFGLTERDLLAGAMYLGTAATVASVNATLLGCAGMTTAAIVSSFALTAIAAIALRLLTNPPGNDFELLKMTSFFTAVPVIFTLVRSAALVVANRTSEAALTAIIGTSASIGAGSALSALLLALENKTFENRR